MKAIFASTLPLPECLGAACGTPEHRRQRIGGFRLTARSVDRFNRVLEHVGAPDPGVDGDRVVTAARTLCQTAVPVALPDCLRQRLQRARAAVSMAGDRGWGPSERAVEIVRAVAKYLASNDDLIPDSIPTVGRLDDAIVIEAAWPALRSEITDYLDFRRLRRLALSDRGRRQGFDRAAWQQAREDEARLEHHMREVRASAYVREPGTLFHIC